MFVLKYALESLDLYLEEGGNPIKIITQILVIVAKSWGGLCKTFPHTMKSELFLLCLKVKGKV